MCVLTFCVLLAQAGNGVGMPAQPDLSGRWTLVAAQPSDASAAKALNVRQTVTRTTIRGDPMPPFFTSIEIERQFDGSATTETHLIGVVGGTVGGVVGPRGNAGAMPPPVKSLHAVRWDDRALVFEQGTYTGDTPVAGDWTERRETWTLQPNGELAMTIATSGSAGPSLTVSAVYRRTN